VINSEFEKVAERNGWKVANCAEPGCFKAVSSRAPRDSGHRLEGRIKDRPYCTKDMDMGRRKRRG
jgi:hypothetical protein